MRHYQIKLSASMRFADPSIKERISYTFHPIVSDLINNLYKPYWWSSLFTNSESPVTVPKSPAEVCKLYNSVKVLGRALQHKNQSHILRTITYS